MNRKSILCIGDSITHGVGEAPNRGWVGRLKSAFETQNDLFFVYNLGIPGERADEILLRMRTEITHRLRFLERTDYYLCISAGTNDAKLEKQPNESFKERKTLGAYKASMKKVISLAKTFPFKHIFVIGLPPVDDARTHPFKAVDIPDERILLFDNALEEIADENEVTYIPVRLAFDPTLYAQLLQDGVHPSSQGYDLMYERIVSVLKSKNVL